MKIHIRQPWYGAFDKFKDWSVGDYGVGIAEYKIDIAIKNKEKLEITVGKVPDVFILRPQTFKKRANYHRGFHVARSFSSGQMVKLLIVPISYLRRFKNE